MIGPCAKTTVTCTIVAPDGERFVGTNYCRNAQLVCPRDPGEGYEKCASICDQVGHAEIVAVGLAGEKAQGARAYLQGHSYACQACQEALFGAGIISLSVGIEPDSIAARPDAGAPMMRTNGSPSKQRQGRDAVVGGVA